MNPVFEIIPKAIFFQQTDIICEISTDSFSYVFANDIDKKFHGLSVFYFNDTEDISEQLKTIFHEQPLLNKNYKKVLISYAGKESSLLPEELYKPGDEAVLLDILFGDLHQTTVTTDHVADKKIFNVYLIPSAIHKVIVDKFPAAVIRHHHSLLIRQGLPTGDLLKILFSTNTFVASLVKAGELQIINTFPYKSGADVVYHLLNICKQFKMENVPLQIGGMIEIDFDLHKEICHYFKEINFDELPAGYEFTNALKELPPHHFSHLFSLASCV